MFIRLSGTSLHKRASFSLYIPGIGVSRYRDRVQDVLDGVGMNWERKITAL